MNVESYLYDDLYALEESHWWHRAKRRYVTELIRRYCRVQNPLIADIGCGTGKNVETWAQFGRAHGIDISSSAIAYCKKRKLTGVRVGRAEKTGYPKHSVDVITLLDVLEHADESAVLSEMHRILRTKGLLVITVPAHTWLWSRWDMALHHKRRYGLRRLQFLLARHGFSVTYISYAYSFLVIPALVIRFIKSHVIRGRYVSDFRLSNPAVNKLFYAISVCEQWLALHGIPMPTGTSLVCVARLSI